MTSQVEAVSGSDHWITIACAMGVLIVLGISAALLMETDPPANERLAAVKTGDLIVILPETTGKHAACLMRVEKRVSTKVLSVTFPLGKCIDKGIRGVHHDTMVAKAEDGALRVIPNERAEKLLQVIRSNLHMYATE